MDKEKLKEQLSKLVNDKSRSNQTIQVVNPLPSKHDLNQNKSQDPMYDIVVSNYEEREKEILQENAYLRQLLYDFYRAILAKLNSDDETQDVKKNSHSLFTEPFSNYRSI